MFFPSFPADAGLKEIQAPYAEIYRHWAKFSQALMRGPGPLSVAERELIAAYTSQLNSCSLCHSSVFTPARCCCAAISC